MSVKDNIILHIRECNTSTLKGLYETSNSNHILFLKTKLLSIKMEEREDVNNYISRIKDLRHKPTDIGEKVFNYDIVTITLKGILADYQMFISSLVAWENPPTFDTLTGILVQEEERGRNFEDRPSRSDMVLLEKGKQPYRK